VPAITSRAPPFSFVRTACAIHSNNSFARLERLVGGVLESTFQLGVDTCFKPPKELTKRGKEAVEVLDKLKAESKYVLLE